MGGAREQNRKESLEQAFSSYLGSSVEYSSSSKMAYFLFRGIGYLVAGDLVRAFDSFSECHELRESYHGFKPYMSLFVFDVIVCTLILSFGCTKKVSQSVDAICSQGQNSPLSLIPFAETSVDADDDEDSSGLPFVDLRAVPSMLRIMDSSDAMNSQKFCQERVRDSHVLDFCIETLTQFV